MATLAKNVLITVAVIAILVSISAVIFVVLYGKKTVSSSGGIFRPQPFFQANDIGPKQSASSVYKEIQFPVNTLGSGFDTFNGRYTSPSSGTFYFEFNVAYTTQVYAAGSFNKMQLVKNFATNSPVVIQSWYLSESVPFRFFMGFAYVEMKTGDTMSVAFIGNTDGSLTTQANGTFFGNFVSSINSALSKNKTVSLLFKMSKTLLFDSIKIEKFLVFQKSFLNNNLIHFFLQNGIIDDFSVWKNKVMSEETMWCGSELYELMEEAIASEKSVSLDEGVVREIKRYQSFGYPLSDQNHVQQISVYFLSYMRWFHACIKLLFDNGLKPFIQELGVEKSYNANLGVLIYLEGKGSVLIRGKLANRVAVFIYCSNSDDAHNCLQEFVGNKSCDHEYDSFRSDFAVVIDKSTLYAELDIPGPSRGVNRPCAQRAKNLTDISNLFEIWNLPTNFKECMFAT